MTKPDWRNLKDGYCPKCYQELEDDNKSVLVKCSSCKFFISRVRFDEILEDMEKEEAGNNAENT